MSDDRRCPQCGKVGQMWRVDQRDDNSGRRYDGTEIQCQACDAVFLPGDMPYPEPRPNYWDLPCECGHCRGDHQGTPEAPGMGLCAHGGQLEHMGCTCGCECQEFRGVTVLQRA